MNNSVELILSELDLLKADLEIQMPLNDPAFQQILAVEYTYDSNRLENSQLSFRQTELVIGNGLLSPERPMQESMAALNHYQAIQYIIEQANEQALLSESIMRRLHSILMQAIDRQHGGIYRDQSASLPWGASLPDPDNLTHLMTEHFEWLRREGPFLHPIIFAAEVHQRIIRLAPFNRGNGLLARLLMNLVLLTADYPLINIFSTDENRLAYLNALQQTNLDTLNPQWSSFIAGQVLMNFQGLLKRLNNRPIDDQS
ncbi:MAG: hypothetical protein RL563_1808 [Pseudomonadota bacterium]|jgi:Fic family protein